MLKNQIFVFLMVVTFCGCSDSDLNIGVWNLKVENSSYVLLTNNDSKEIGEYPLAPFPSANSKHWIRVKDIGETQEKIKPNLEAYSIKVVEHGFVFLGVTQGIGKNSSLDDVEWGWRVILQNKSKHDVYAYGDYKLFDKEGFPLTKIEGLDWNSEEEGVIIKSGEQGVIKGVYHWTVYHGSNPYLPKRVMRGDFKLFLRHDSFENINLREKIN